MRKEKGDRSGKEAGSSFSYGIVGVMVSSERRADEGNCCL